MYGPLIEGLLTEAGAKPALSFYPTARSRALFASGAADADFFRIAKLPSDYPPDVLLIGPLQAVRFSMFVRADATEPKDKSAASLWRLPLGYVRGTLAVEGLIRERGVTQAEAYERDSAIRLLIAGRLDVVVDSERLFLQALKEIKPPPQIALAHTVLEEPTYLLLQGKFKHLEPALRLTLQRWLESGRWQREYQAANRLNGLPPDMGLVKSPPAQSGKKSKALIQPSAHKPSYKAA